MVDFLDRAQKLEKLERTIAIATARAAICTGPGRSNCQNCEKPISPARRKVVPGCRFCIKCQRELEERR
ncbi:MAG: TraR/DksA family transcriptional regulator [Desulfobacteraceae bacterium]|nr:TraR/DksA family transcriptional regulator [Desulfobacteraceae bacterium]